jgi:hypothetical protein
VTTEATNYCAIHDEEEGIPADNANVCFECGHVYATPEEVVELWAEVFPNGKQYLPEEWENIPFCPLCLHDW